MFILANLLIAVAQVLAFILGVYKWIIIARVFISWVNPDPYNPIVRFLHSATEPVLYRVRRDGLAFFGFIFLYSLMRFGVSELRLDSREILAGLTTPQVTALFLIPMALAGLIWAWLRPGSGEPDALAPGQAVAATGPPSG